jgi:hypothetical protein
VHLWAFENNFDDTSGNNNHGTQAGSPAFVTGKFGQAISIASATLDGVHLDFGAVGLPQAGNASWSMNAWVKLATAPANLEYVAGWGLNNGFVGALDTGGTRAMITFGGASNNNFYFWGGSRDVNSGVQYAADDAWHMYTVTYNGTAMQMYKDALPVLANPVNVALNAALDEVHVGNPSNWNSNFDGQVDEFSIFDAVLSAGQIGGLFFNNNINQPVVFDPSFTVDRDTTEIVLNNNSNFPIDVLGYTIRSASGSLRPLEWDTIAGRFDAPPGGDGSIDNNDDWMVFTNTSLNYSIEMSEGVPGTDGGTIAVGKVVNFGPSWVANPREDLVIDLLLNDGQGTVKTIVAQYSGNNDMAYGLADLDTDGDVDLDDWDDFRTAPSHNFTGLTQAEAYLNGDLDGDFDKDINDFNIFVRQFNAGAGAGAFERLVGGVPEPSSVLLVAMGAVTVLAWRRRRTKFGATLCAFVIAACATNDVHAQLWGYYPLNSHSNDASLNNINLNPVGNTSYAGSLHPGLNAAATFDGAGDGLIGGGFNKFTSNDVTVVAWAYADSLAGDWNSIVKNWGTTAGGQFHLGLGSTVANTLQNFISDNNVNTNVTAPGTTLFPENTWVHTAFVLDSVNLQHRLYMNGVVVAQGAYSGILTPGGATITGLGIGHKPNDDGTELSNNGPGPWNGRIDEVGLYNFAMTTAEIQEIYNDGLAGIQLDGTTSPYVSIQVNRADGVVKVRNTTMGDVSFNSYQVSSPSGRLNPANWLDLAGNAGFPTGTGTGNGWEKDLGSDSTQLLETYLTGSSLLGAGLEISLGDIFTGGTEDLQFSFRNSDGVVIDSLVDYIGVAPGVPGDYNGDNKVDAADYVLWRKNPAAHGGTPDGYNTWRSNFGTGTGAGSGVGGAPVPEPASGTLLTLAVLNFAALAKQSGRECRSNNR